MGTRGSWAYVDERSIQHNGLAGKGSNWGAGKALGGGVGGELFR